MSDKNYVGSGWEKKFDNGGSIINLSLRLEDLNKLPVDKYGCIKLTVGSRQSASTSKATHNVFENSYVPQGQPVQQTQSVQSVQNNQFAMPPNISIAEIDIGEMPF